MDLLFWRLYTSLMIGGTGELYWLLSSASKSKFFDQVYVTKASKPCENRFVTFALRASYQVFPSGLKYCTRPRYSENPRSVSPTVNPAGNSGKGGSPNPRDIARGQ